MILSAIKPWILTLCHAVSQLFTNGCQQEFFPYCRLIKGEQQNKLTYIYIYTYNQAINSMDNWVGFFYQNTNKDPFYNIFTFTFFLFTETFLILY